ncbi:YhgE/Pip domain-containing protein [Planctomonas sp. JC2975]|uniref:YhgE/Pip domain-containing protein n=1 Tax=Planctomonas sp. JC2975 TaxID=2729626 RepID=UPI0014759F5F|nr:YhgE/Pip domain-containing protein [Planctomonas sp. JC2975]NNC12283.1 YhgE/Pip domain-containing protein [Planctomonas sp. JC2975]
MKVPQMIAAELRRLTASRMATIALLALMCVPVIYGALYLWANQNPYAKLDQIPAAIVVSDTGTTVDGKSVNYGQKVADQLVEDGTFDWHAVSATTAAKGLNNQKYDFAITLPSDFSRQLASASTTTPQKATVTLTTNDTNSYLASTIGQQAAQTIKASIVQEVNHEAASRFLLALADIRSSLSDAADAARQLADGAATAHTGAATLADGTAQLTSGSASLRDGLNTLATQTSDLPSQTAQLANGAQQVAAGNEKVAAVADQAGSLAQQAADAVPSVRAQIIADLQAKGVDQATIDQVMAQLDQLGTKVTDGNQQVQTAVGQLDQLSSGSQQLAAGASQLAASAPALSGGIQQAASGASQLADGSAQAATGAASLRDGLSTLADGTSKLQDGLDAGVQQIPATTASERAAQAKTIADPVALKNSKEASAGTYGAGLAPFFIALSAWIGIYALFLIVKPVSRRAITALRTPLRVTLAGWLTPALLGIIQMIGLYAIVAGALHFGVSNPFATFGLMALASVTFASIILALNVWLGSVGQFLGLVLMVLQLVTAGGTFPWQTLPGPLAALHHALPMSYAVDGIRQTMYGGNASLAVGDALFLLAWLAVALVLTAIGVIRMTHRRTLRDLQPSLIG